MLAVVIAAGVAVVVMEQVPVLVDERPATVGSPGVTPHREAGDAGMNTHHPREASRLDRRPADDPLDTISRSALASRPQGVTYGARRRDEYVNEANGATHRGRLASGTTKAPRPVHARGLGTTWPD